MFLPKVVPQTVPRIMHAMQQQQALTSRTSVTGRCNTALLLSRGSRHHHAGSPLPAPSSRSPAVVCLATAAAKSKGFGSSAPKPPSKGPRPAPTQPIVDPCACGSGKNYKNCCERVHQGSAAADTPEAALKARFTAYVRGQPQYVIRTTHPDFFPFHYNKPDGDEVQLRFAGDVEEACSKFVYADFKVVQVEPGSHADEGFVAFSYKFAKRPESESDAVPDEAWSMTDEKCRFQRVNGVWLFTDYQSYTRNLAQLLSQAEAKVLSKPAGQEPQAP